MKVTYYNKTIWTIENFLTIEECEELILFSEVKGYQEAKVGLSTGDVMMKGIRNNQRLIYNDEKLSIKYWDKLKTSCPQQIEDNDVQGLNEQFRFYKYESNQRFKRHIDGRYKKNDNEESRITFMIYLNSDFVGGETKFDDVTIVPKVGKALCFIHEQKHEGCPIEEGSKYVIRTDVMYKKRK